MVVLAASRMFSSTETQAVSPRISADSLVRMNCSRWAFWNRAKNDAATRPHPCRLAQPGWVHRTRSECSQTFDMSSRSRASKAA